MDPFVAAGGAELIDDRLRLAATGSVATGRFAAAVVEVDVLDRFVGAEESTTIDVEAADRLEPAASGSGAANRVAAFVTEVDVLGRFLDVRSSTAEGRVDPTAEAARGSNGRAGASTGAFERVTGSC